MFNHTKILAVLVILNVRKENKHVLNTLNEYILNISVYRQKAGIIKSKIIIIAISGKEIRRIFTFLNKIPQTS